MKTPRRTPTDRHDKTPAEKYGSTLAPTDLDFFIKADTANARATHAALAAFGAALQDIRPEDFADRGSFFRFGREPRGFDILPDIPGVEFDAAWQRPVGIVVDPVSGLTANFISAEDLMATNLAAGRPQDIAEVDAIRKASQAQAPPRPASKVPGENDSGDERP